MQFPLLSDEKRMQRLQPAAQKIRMVLDTDTYNEIDDQFAVVYALLSPEKLTVEALYAAPFFNNRAENPADGMRKSYEEILRLFERLGASSTDFVYQGSEGFLSDLANPYRSPAALDLIDRAMASAVDDPLYVVAIGALTNIASALLIEPGIAEHIVVIWLGGHALYWPHTVEFNLAGDVMASRLVLDSGVPLTLIPCAGVTTHLRSTVAEIERYVQGRGDIGDYLAETFKSYEQDHFGWSKEIWDVVTIGYLINPHWVPSNIVASPIITQKTSVDTRSLDPSAWMQHPLTWSFDSTRHLIRCAYYVDRDPMFRDLFIKLDLWANNKITLSR